MQDDLTEDTLRDHQRKEAEIEVQLLDVWIKRLETDLEEMKKRKQELISKKY